MNQLLNNLKNRLVPNPSHDDRSPPSVPVPLFGHPSEQVGSEAYEVKDSQGEELKLTRMIGYITATGCEDWSLILEVCERASASPAASKHAVKCLRREFKYGEPSAKLSAARLWAIMLRNSSEVFIRQCASHKFIGVLEDVIISTQTSPVLWERLLEVLAGAAYATKDDSDLTVFRALWSKCRPIDKPSEGIPFDSDDPMFNPPDTRSSAKTPDFQTHAASSYNPTQEESSRYATTVIRNAASLEKALVSASSEDLRLNAELRYLYYKCEDSYQLISEAIFSTLTSPGDDEEQSLATLQAAHASLKGVLQTWQDIEAADESDEASRYSRLAVPDIIQLLREGIGRKTIVAYKRDRLFHASCDRLRDACEGLWIYQQSAGYLVTLWEYFVQHCITTILKCDTDRGLDADSFLGSLEWYQVLADQLLEWSNMDILYALASWESIKEALSRIHRSCPQGILRIPAPSEGRPVTPQDFNPSIGETIYTVNAVVTSRYHVEALMSLGIQDKVSVVDLFDEILRTVEDEDFHKRIFRILRKLCPGCGALPRSFYIPSSELSKLEHESDNFGGFADVWRGQYSGRQVALKIFRVHRNNRAAMLKVFCREAVSWKYLCHPNVVPFLGIEETENQLCMVSVWMRNGSIMNYLKESPASNRMQLLIDVAQGLQYLHSVGIIHADLKGPNILISDDHRACLIDFGLASVIHDPDTIHLITTTSTVQGTTRWMAPELLDPDQFEQAQGRPSEASDIYALAMVMLEVFSGALPFGTLPNEAAIIWKVMRGDRPSRPLQAISLGLSDVIWELMTRCWQQNPSQRPSMPHVVDIMQSQL